MEHIPDDATDVVETLLAEIEKNIPVQAIYIDKCNDAIVVEDKAQYLEDDIQLGITLIDKAIKYGKELNDAVDTIMKAEPWCCHPQMKEMLKNYYSNEHNQRGV